MPEMDSNDHTHVCVKCGKVFDCDNYRCQKRKYSFHKVCLLSTVTEVSRQETKKEISVIEQYSPFQ